MVAERRVVTRVHVPEKIHSTADCRHSRVVQVTCSKLHAVAANARRMTDLVALAGRLPPMSFIHVLESRKAAKADSASFTLGHFPLIPEAVWQAHRRGRLPGAGA
jgi:hypothetical protein